MLAPRPLFVTGNLFQLNGRIKAESCFGFLLQLCLDTITVMSFSEHKSNTSYAALVSELIVRCVLTLQ